MNYKLFTNPGTREINEDRIGLAMHGDSYCFVVADGLGGHGNGEVQIPFPQRAFRGRVTAVLCGQSLGMQAPVFDL